LDSFSLTVAAWGGLKVPVRLFANYYFAAYVKSREQCCLRFWSLR